jgi:dolichol-phosphate mannosyltransferase
MLEKAVKPNLLLPVPTGRLQIAGTPTPQFSSIQLSLVLPTYNESDNVVTLVTQLSRLLDRVLGDRYELILVDDDSPDRTWEIAQALMFVYPQLRVMRRQGERGLSTAVIRGWQVARGEVLGVIDADLQHPPETLLQLLEEIDDGADLAIASRHVANGGVSEWSLARRILSRGAQVLGLLILPGVVGRVSDPMSGYFIVHRRAIADKLLDPVGYKISIEVLGRGDIGRIAEVGYVFQERQEGASKVTFKQYTEYLHHLLRLRLCCFPLHRFLRFGMVGLSGMFVDLAIFYLLRSSLYGGLTLSAVVSSEVAIFNNFIWNDAWTFGDLSRRQRGWSQKSKRFIKFNLVCLIGVVANVVLVNLLYSQWGMSEYVAKLIAIAIVTFWNFWINLKLSWRVTEVDR